MGEVIIIAFVMEADIFGCMVGFNVDPYLYGLFAHQPVYAEGYATIVRAWDRVMAGYPPSY